MHPMAPRDPTDELDEDPSPEDMERFGGVTRTCPECKSEVYDDAEICHECGHAFSGEAKNHPLMIPVMIAIIVALLVGYAAWAIL
jgi:hypothetical protein